jgi:hypothetical protein
MSELTMHPEKPCPIAPCSACKQRGVVETDTPAYYATVMPPREIRVVPCPACGGYGWNWKEARDD